MAGVGNPIAFIAETEADLEAAKAKAGESGPQQSQAWVACHRAASTDCAACRLLKLAANSCRASHLT